MNLIIYVNENFEEERALFDIEEEKVLLKGDFYHDKIDERIEGYLEALKDFHLYEKEVETKWINANHNHYTLLDFYEE